MTRRIVLLLTASLTLMGCHLFEDPKTLDECPLNSGYPCPCQPGYQDGQCDDDSRCVFFDDAQKGVCARSCDGDADDASCRAEGWDNADGLCRLREAVSTPNRCLVACEDASDCPAGMSCLWRNDSARGPYSACYPVEAEFPGPCESLCTRYAACSEGAESALSESECNESCTDNDWVTDACRSCWVACDVSLACDAYMDCLVACGCD